jgi:pimeloyl-ACP methyl ester carboxylesterase
MLRLLLLAFSLALSSEPSGPSLAEASSRFATLDGHRIHYKTLGSGSGKEAVFFVHGWTCDMSVWRFQAPAFAKDRRVIVVDLPGHGGSDAPEIDYTMALFARSIDAVMREEGVSRVVLVGHSMGTPVVREFYRLHPEKTSALVAVDGSFRVLVSDPAAREKFLAPFRGPEYREALARFADLSFPPEQAALRDSMKTVMTKTPQHVLVSAAQSMLDPANFREDSIRVPLLNVLAKSPFWTEDDEAFLRKLAPGVDYRIMDGAGHFLMLQKAEEFNAMLSAFLAKQRG